MTKIVVRLPEPKKEYSEDNQRQINRSLASIVNRSWSSFCCLKNVEFNCSTIEAKDLLICLWLSSLYSFLGSGNLTTTFVIILSFHQVVSLLEMYQISTIHLHQYFLFLYLHIDLLHACQL